MPTRRPAETTPDLFSAPPPVTAAGPSAVAKGKAGPDNPASQQRHFLPKDLATPGGCRGGAGSLTTGKLNAVRADFKAGVKPSAIARQFGISQSDVRKALAQ